MNDNALNIQIDNFKKEFFKYFSFWPIFLTSILLAFLISFIFLRYSDKIYRTEAVIEIIDKAQDSEMALPTTMTIFNRSMINLENEFGRLKSYNLNSKIVSELKANVDFFNVGIIKSGQESRDRFFEKFHFKFKMDTDTINTYSKFLVKVEDEKLLIRKLNKSDDNVLEYFFQDFDTNSMEHNLPFEIKVKDNYIKKNFSQEIIFIPFRVAVERFISNLNVSQYAGSSGVSGNYNTGSDQIKLSYTHQNSSISEEYLNALITNFNLDGIQERQLEYKRTIDFVDKRAIFLEKEVKSIERKKQEFKSNNSFTDIASDAELTINKQYDYDSELFNLITQKDLITILKNELSIKKYELLPAHFGINNSSINELINSFNVLVLERLRIISFGAGSKNSALKNLESQLDKIFENILSTIKSFTVNLDKSISRISDKEKEFKDLYFNIPQNERILREIQRELEVKEALYSLLLQKREEASINLAVVRPSIKLIDSPRSTLKPIYPIDLQTYFIGLFFGFFFPFSFLFIRFYFDNKIHTKEDLLGLKLPIVGELPYIKDFKNQYRNINEINSSSRSPFIEGMRMLVTNLSYKFIDDKKNISKSVIVTSSVKGEGKTAVSVNLARVLSFSNKKTILIGADLRNPQIHNHLELSRDKIKGLTDYLFMKNSNWNDFIYSYDKLDILLSGTIPPNPSDLLSSEKFKNLLENLKSHYDYVVIDTAPCLLVADTFEFSKYVDHSILVVRSNHSNKNILQFISETDKEKKLNNLSLVLNGIGNSAAYGYKYGYQYGYQYGYKYDYNYGYGYGYSDDKN